jgi:hypothetical protein
MASTIQIKRGSGIPGSLAEGELAVDVGAKVLYAGNSSGVLELSRNTIDGLDLSDGSNTITIQASSGTQQYTLNLPTTDGEADQVLTTDGSGNLTWAAGGEVFIDGTPANNQIAIWKNASNLEGDGNLTFDGTTFAVTGQTTISANVAVNTDTLFVDTVNNRVGINTTSLLSDIYPVAVDMPRAGFAALYLQNANTGADASIGLDFYTQHSGYMSIWREDKDDSSFPTTGFTRGTINHIDSVQGPLWLQGDGTFAEIILDSNDGQGIRIGYRRNYSVYGDIPGAGIEFIVNNASSSTAGKSVAQKQTDAASGTATRGNGFDFWIHSNEGGSANNNEEILDGIAIGRTASVGVYHLQEDYATEKHSLGFFTGTANTFVDAMRIDSSGTVTINHELIVVGNTTITNSTTVSIEDSMLKLGANNVNTDTVDSGFYTVYEDSGVKYAGVLRDASDGSGVFKVWAGFTTEPGVTANFGEGALAQLDAIIDGGSY